MDKENRFQRQSKTYDTVIMGAGAAGLMAALVLSENQKKVLVIEKGKSFGVSNFARAGGPAACETEIQKREGVAVTREELFSHMSGWARHTVNEALLYEVISRTGCAVDKMAKLGIEFELMQDTYQVGFRARHMIKTARGKKLAAPLCTEIEKNGGELLCNAQVLSVKKQENFEITLHIAGEEQEHTVCSKNLLICTGGFQGNPEMARRFLGIDHLVSLGNPLSTGDGIETALSLGAVLDRNFALPGNEGSATTSKCKGYNDHLSFGIYGGLLVDHNGNRFMNEKDIADFPLAIGGEAFARHQKTYALVDDTVYQACKEQGIYSFLGEPKNWPAGKALWHPVLSHLDEHREKAVRDGWMAEVNSLAEAAEYFQLEHLELTVESYNRMCDLQKDSVFGKAPNFLLPIRKAPFYIMEYEPACWCTLGGIKTDSLLQALDREGRLIRGLYVAGADNGSMYSVPYYDNEGAALGLALGSGIYAAQQMIGTEEA